MNQTIFRVKLRSYTNESIAHSHEYYQWILPLSGNLDIEIGHHGGVIDQNQGGLVLPQEKHSYSSKSENMFIIMDVLSEKTWMNNTIVPSFWSLPPTLQKFLPFAYDFLTQNQDLASHNLVADFLQKLLMQQFFNNQDSLIAKAINWIDIYYADPINLKVLASYCCLGISQLQRRFKKMMGQSIGEYWRHKRLQHSLVLLTKTAKSIEIIAYTVGYENIAAFSRSFSNEFGMSPSSYRNMQLSAKDMQLSDKR